MPHLAATCPPIARGGRSDRTPRPFSMSGHEIISTVRRRPVVSAPIRHGVLIAAPLPDGRFIAHWGALCGIAHGDALCGIAHWGACCRLALRHEIDAACMPRIAAQNTPSGQGSAAQGAVFAEGINRVVAAAWPEPAIRADHRTHRPLIGPHRANRAACRQFRDQGHARCHATPTFFIARWMSFLRSENGRPRVPSRPINTRSNPDTG